MKATNWIKGRRPARTWHRIRWFVVSNIPRFGDTGGVTFSDTDGNAIEFDMSCEEMADLRNRLSAALRGAGYE